MTTMTDNESWPTIPGDKGQPVPVPTLPSRKHVDDLARMSDQEITDRYANLYGFIVFHKLFDEPHAQALAPLEAEMNRRGIAWDTNPPNREERRARARRMRIR